MNLHRMTGRLNKRLEIKSDVRQKNYKRTFPWYNTKEHVCSQSDMTVQKLAFWDRILEANYAYKTF